ncbi:FtsK/SpoIIIE domain-containing protein [Saccharococcus caldoxylosilyticus]|uniref:FtsK/SpoIIIE domain-containing protein n=1 Tax=Saccharococcus caldoxylosilyticus TaxID=81408 RepID=UPI001F475751|nr:FtsK/SpoIIIE domain-containing protein [Parageobacillus caldoxylosilyticus]
MFFLFELLAIPVLAGTAAILSGVKNKQKEERVIDTVFRNLKVGAVEGKEFVYPKLVATEQKDYCVRYVYRVPLGIPKKALEPVEEILAATLDRPVEVTFKKWLYIDVFQNDIPEKVPYSDVPNMPGWVVPLGFNEKGWIFHDFDKTPHCVAGGTTRFGKTVFLKMMMTYLIEHHPNDVEFLIIDMKGGLEFDRYREIKQVIDVASDPIEAFECLTSIKVLLEQKMAEFKRNGWSNVVHTPIQKRMFIIVDEAAQLVPEKFMEKPMRDLLSYCQSILSEIARIGGALGIRLIFCTQYPTSDTLPRQIKQNADLKISFRLPTGYASAVVIDEQGAEELPSDIPGRAIIKTHEKKIVQVPYITDDEMTKRLEVYRIAKVRKTHRAANEDTIFFE